MTTRPVALSVLLPMALALGLPGPRADAHPLIRLHVRPSAYRVAPPRLPNVNVVGGIVHQAAGLLPLAPAAAGLAGPSALARDVITQAPGAALNLLHHR